MAERPTASRRLTLTVYGIIYSGLAATALAGAVIALSAVWALGADPADVAPTLAAVTTCVLVVFLRLACRAGRLSDAERPPEAATTEPGVPSEEPAP